MAAKVQLDPELAELVERTRKELAEQGVWPRKKPLPPFEPMWPPEVAEVLIEWVREGGYAAAIAKIEAEYPDLARQ